jgi:hypothetical protein
VTCGSVVAGGCCVVRAVAALLISRVPTSRLNFSVGLVFVALSFFLRAVGLLVGA